MTEVVPTKRMSRTAMASFLFGLASILLLLPVGFLAIILGVLGILKTRVVGVTGRWMAIVGIALGVLNSVAWVAQGPSISALMLITTGYWGSPTVVAQDYLNAMANSDLAKAGQLSQGIDEDDLKSFSAFVRHQGVLSETSLSYRSLKWRVAELSGTAQFPNGNSEVHVVLLRQGPVWKVINMRMSNAQLTRSPG